MCNAMIPVAMNVTSQLLKLNHNYQEAQIGASYKAQLAENEASTQKQLAQREIQKGIVERNQQQRSALRQMGSLRAGMGASGFTMDSESNLSLLEEGAMERQHESNAIDQNARMAAWQHEVASTNALNQKSIYEAQAKNSGMGVGSSLLGILGSGLSKFMKASSAKK